jgi:regulator of protease activity HflC (stomatin/prohibitin superfamily)
MELQMRAERERRAAILEAEGVKQSKILRAEGERGALIARAEGDRQSHILRAEGEAQSIAVVAAALEKEQVNPAEYLIAVKYLATLGDIGTGEGGDKTVFMPYEASGVLGSLGSIKEMFSAAGGSAGNGALGGQTPPPLPPA